MDFLVPHVGQKVLLPLATGATRFVSFELDAPPGAPPGAPGGPPLGGPPYLCCWTDEDAAEPKFYIPLRGCRIVNNITELGPCLYFIASTGEFEFQCPNRQVCARWVEALKSLGVSLLKFTDLYKLTEFIGEGSFAKVYIGRHLFTGEDVVIKAVDKKKVLESNVYTEIEVLRKVSHPYIMRLYAAYEQEDFVCLVLEYLRGGELFDYLSEKGHFSEDQARHAMRRLLLALQALHMKGIVHRDLKTENLIIEHPNNPASIKIIDFGLAATVGSQEMKMRCGSPGYVAPEILQDLPYGPKVDVFSSGVILYTLLVGFPPFRGQNVKDILKKNLRCQISFNHQRWASIPHSVKDLIGWMCCKQPAKRCAAVQALTHPWFQRIARPLPKAAATSAAALEESDLAMNLEHVIPEQRDTEPPSPIGEDTQGDSAEPLGKGLRGLSLRPKDSGTIETRRGPSFFNSAPPGATGMKGAQTGRDKLYDVQSTESQRSIRGDKPKQTHAEATQAAVKAAVKTIGTRDAAAARAAKAAAVAPERAAADIAPEGESAERKASAVTVTQQPLWLVKERQEESLPHERFPSGAREKASPLLLDANAAAASAAASAVAVLDATVQWSPMQRQQQEAQAVPCGREKLPFANALIGSVMVRASETPLAAEVCEPVESFDSDGPSSSQACHLVTLAAETLTEQPQEASAAAQPTVESAAARAATTGQRRPQLEWLEEIPYSSGVSTQASPSGAVQDFQLAPVSPALERGASERSDGFSSRRGGLNDGSREAFCVAGPLTCPCETSDTPDEMDESSHEQRNHTRAKRAEGRGAGTPAAEPDNTPRLSHIQHSWTCYEGPPEGLPEVIPPGLPNRPPEESSQGSPKKSPGEVPQPWQVGDSAETLAKICNDSTQGHFIKCRQRSNVQPPKPSEAPTCKGQASLRVESQAESPEFKEETTPGWGDPPQGLHPRSSQGGDTEVHRPVCCSIAGGIPGVSLPRPATAKRQDGQQGAVDGSPHHTGGTLRTVKMQPYKQLHSHHYLVSRANEVIRSGSLPSGGMAQVGCARGLISVAVRVSELERPTHGLPDTSRTVGGPRGPTSGGIGWKPFAVTGDSPGCSYEGSKTLRPTTRKETGKALGASRGEGPSVHGTSPHLVGPISEGFATPHGRFSSNSSSSNSSNSSRSNRQQQQPFHVLQSRLSEFMGLPVLSKMASALGARDWLRGKGRSNTTPLPGTPRGDTTDRGTSTKSSRNGKKQSRDMRSSNRTFNRDKVQRGRPGGPLDEV